MTPSDSSDHSDSDISESDQPSESEPPSDSEEPSGSEYPSESDRASESDAPSESDRESDHESGSTGSVDDTCRCVWVAVGEPLAWSLEGMQNGKVGCNCVDPTIVTPAYEGQIYVSECDCDDESSGGSESEQEPSEGSDDEPSNDSGSEPPCECVWISEQVGSSFYWTLQEAIGGGPCTRPPETDPGAFGPGFTQTVPCDPPCLCIWLASRDEESNLYWQFDHLEGHDTDGFDCPCKPPSGAPSNFGDRAETPCECKPPESSSSDGSDESIDESDDQSESDEDCQCLWTGMYYPAGGLYWSLALKSPQLSDCECNKPPSGEPSFFGQQVWLPCNCGESSSGSESDAPPSESESEDLPSDHSSESENPSEGSQDSQSDRQSDHESQSDKSTAIVPASFTDDGYTALFTLEAPEVRFDDVMTVTMMDGRETIVPIDPKYVEVCERGTITISGAVPDEPVVVGAKVIDGDKVRIRLDRHVDDAVTIAVRLTAIRRGFLGKRFPNRTREQFLANERHIQSAYPGAGQ